MSNAIKTILIVGAGESGLGAALLAARQGYRVRVSEAGRLSLHARELLTQLNANWEEEGHTPQMLEDVDMVVKSPGVHPSNLLVSLANERGIPLISDIEFGYLHTTRPVVAITGTNGKSTATALIGHLLTCAEVKAVVCGNIGVSFCRAIVEHPEAEWWVVEVSSFQLVHTVQFRPRIAIILNITPDHLDWHASLEDYIQAKLKISKNLTAEDHLLYNAEDPIITSRFATLSNKGTLHPLYSHKAPQLRLTTPVHPITLAAAQEVARIFNISNEIFLKALRTFRGLPHRLQYAGSIGGVAFINDSKATNIASAQFAIEQTPAPIVWIVGGLDKGNDYTPLVPLIKQKVKAIVVHARNPELFVNVFSGLFPTLFIAKTMEEAVWQAWQAAQCQGTVLLSPACASFDLYKNYAQRGEAFMNAVQKLKNSLHEQHME